MMCGAKETSNHNQSNHKQQQSQSNIGIKVKNTKLQAYESKK